MPLSIGDERLLVLRRTPDLQSHRILLVGTVDEALAVWDWSTRVSPIFHCRPSTVPDLAQGDIQLYFCGPVKPARVPENVPTFLTFGTFNVILAAATPDHAQRISEFLAADELVCWERWHVVDGLVVETEFSRYAATRAPHIHPAIASEPNLRSALEENRCLISSAIARAERYFPGTATELVAFDTAFSEKINRESTKHEMERLSWLVNVNAHLSRFSAQTFCGTSPIAGTESHFWTHSLLGIGTATSALRSIKGFVESAVDQFDMLDRLESLKSNPVIGDQLLVSYRIDEPIWDQFAAAVKPSAAPAPRDDDSRIPLIVCFSARDGFRSTPFSLSAPLELIPCANTYGWTPLTLTHELCHVLVTSTLGKLFPNITEAAGLDALDEFFDSETPAVAKNAFEQVQHFVYIGLSALHLEQYGVSTWEEVPPKGDGLPRQLLSFHLPAVNELLTHVVDFQLFFNGNEKLYVNCIWSSWDTIPDIKDRLSEYLIRSACAIYSGRLREADGIANSLDKLQEFLEALSASLTDGQYLKRALELLRNDTEHEFRRAVARRLHLIRFAYFFLCKPELRALLQHERAVSGGPYSAFKVRQFASENVVTNPLGFLRQFADDKRSDKGKSLWILHNLAFASHDPVSKN